MIKEAGRLLDRLDRLDEQLTGRDDRWLRVDQYDGDLVLIVDKGLAEARNLAMAYARLVSELRQLGIVKTGAGAETGTPGGDLVDELKARRDRSTA